MTPLLHDEFSRSLWAHDASLFEIQPHAIVLPETVHEVQYWVNYAKTHSLAITARGGGTGTTGGALGKGLIVDVSRSMRSIIRFHTDDQSVTVEAGATLDDVNNFLRPLGRMIGADISTHDRATIGGMIASNAAGAHSRTWGSMREQIEEIEIVLSNGSIVSCGFISIDTCQHVTLASSLLAIREKYKELILRETPSIQRRAFHIPLDELCYPSGMHIARLIAGTQGTLGIITKARLKTVPITEVKGAILLSFSSVIEALQATQDLVAKEFYGIELIDKTVVEAAKKVLGSGGLSLFPNSCTAYVLLETARELPASLLKSLIPSTMQGLASISILTNEEYDTVLFTRREGLSHLLSTYKGKTASGFIEDLICPLEVMPQFYQEIFHILDSYSVPFAVYGHMGAGCLHIRPFLHVREETSERALIPQIMKQVVQVVQKYQGVMSSEHGSGLIRSWLTPFVFSPEYQAALTKVKSIFDPLNIMNPGKLFPPYDDFSSYFTASTKSTFSQNPDRIFFRSHGHGGLEKSLDSCTNNGRCRKGDGLMCPPFQITRDERDSTRGRTHALLTKYEKASFDSTPNSQESDDAFQRVLDFCIQCKGCIQECPSHINIAKIKEEELWREKEKAHYFSKKHLRSWIVSHIPTKLPLLPVFIKKITKTLASFRVCNWLCTTLLDFSSDALSSISPSSEARFSPRDISSSQATVILFIDAFTEISSPNAIKAAYELLTVLGERPILYYNASCGRALFSKGYLEEGEKEAKNILKDITDISKTIPVLFLEPSVWSAIHDEWKDLPHLDPQEALSFSLRARSIEEYVAVQREKLQELAARCPTSNPITILYHQHCHTRSLAKSSHIFFQIKSLLEIFPNVTCISDPKASCCGMAGSFGIEKEHETLSREIGKKAFHLLEKTPIQSIVASGVSCRSQAKRLFPSLSVVHPIEFLYDLVRSVPNTRKY